MSDFLDRVEEILPELSDLIDRVRESVQFDQRFRDIMEKEGLD